MDWVETHGIGVQWSMKKFCLRYWHLERSIIMPEATFRGESTVRFAETDERGQCGSYGVKK